MSPELFVNSSERFVSCLELFINCFELFTNCLELLRDIWCVFATAHVLCLIGSVWFEYSVVDRIIWLDIYDYVPYIYLVLSRTIHPFLCHLSHFGKMSSCHLGVRCHGWMSWRSDLDGDDKLAKPGCYIEIESISDNSRITVVFCLIHGFMMLDDRRVLSWTNPRIIFRSHEEFTCFFTWISLQHCQDIDGHSGDLGAHPGIECSHISLVNQRSQKMAMENQSKH